MINDDGEARRWARWITNALFPGSMAPPPTDGTLPRGAEVRDHALLPARPSAKRRKVPRQMKSPR